MPATEWILRGDGVGQHPDDREVRGAQLCVQARVLQHGTRVVAEREEHVVVELLEPASPVCANDNARELVAHVYRQGDETADLPIRRRRPVSRLILTHDLVAL